ncbi:hypothetical protein HMI55_002455 [Coelomomyces lativittatus]|nr:hypothetical protein HMI55_002455 [Coelomomyces lativittatus]
MYSLGDSDPFTSRLYSMYLKLKDKGSLKQPISLGVFRSDYLLHLENDQQTCSLRQVELNTMACSFACLSNLTTQLHQYTTTQLETLAHHYPSENLPPNPTTPLIVNAFKQAHVLYGQPEAILIIVVQPNERNRFDQRHLEHALFSTYKLKMLRFTLLEIYNQSKLVDDRLFISNQDLTSTTTPPSWMEVAIVYYRAGYTPDDYVDARCWEARERMEGSLAIQCPSLAQQLTGTKKMQQAWTVPDVLASVFPDPTMRETLQRCFMDMYPMDTSDRGQSAYHLAMHHPSQFVLKPQREGGGNNLYGPAIPGFLQSVSKKDLQGYILMQRIGPPSQQGLLVHPHQPLLSPTSVISELGIYGTWVADGDRVVLNQAAGHLLRTKIESSDEGGVAAGFAVLDSPFLV